VQRHEARALQRLAEGSSRRLITIGWNHDRMDYLYLAVHRRALSVAPHRFRQGDIGTLSWFGVIVASIAVAREWVATQHDPNSFFGVAVLVFASIVGAIGLIKKWLAWKKNPHANANPLWSYKNDWRF
jgi:hypothetical protein